MADIKVTCVSCGSAIMVSEFVDPEQLSCAQCGGRLSVPLPTVDESAPGIGFKVEEEPVPVELDAEELRAKKKRIKTARRKYRKTKASKRVGGPPQKKGVAFRIAHLEISENALGWFLGLIFTPIMIWLRFFAEFKAETLDEVAMYGQIALGLCYLIVVAEATREEMFDGILCLFFPPFALWYLFAKSDSFCLRAIMIALTAGFGWDMYLLFVHYFEIAIEWSHDAIVQDGYE